MSIHQKATGNRSKATNRGLGPKGLRRKFRDDESGIAALEFAIISPVLIALLFGMLNFSNAMFRYNKLQHVANETNRVIAYSDMSDEEAIKLAQDQLGAAFSQNLTFLIARKSGEYRTFEISGPTASMTLVKFPYTALEHFMKDFTVRSVSPEFKTSSFATGR
ncbi:MAG: TadE/TadG family type IV pilus assembly protein [Litorimonas sp.]